MYFDTDDVEATSEKVKSIGGTVAMGKSPVPGMGYFAICEDTEGNTFGLWEATSPHRLRASPRAVATD